MSCLPPCAPSRWGDFLTIPDDAIPTRSGEDADLFVGKNQSMRMTFLNGTVTKFRDIVVLGNLEIMGNLGINGSNPNDVTTKPRIIARDFFTPGNVVVRTVNIDCRHLHLPENGETFRNELLKAFIEWQDIQRVYREQIGLKSILV